MSSALAEMKIQKLKMSDFTNAAIFEDAYDDLVRNFKKNNTCKKKKKEQIQV